MVASPSNPRVVFFVDGFNLYHSVKEAERQMVETQLKWLDLTALCTSYLHQIGGGAELAEIHYFTAYAEHLKDKNPDKLKRHKAFVRALTAQRVKAHISKFSQKKVWSDELNDWFKVHEEKETDVAIACEVLGKALDNELDVVVLMTGDSDFAPVAQTFHQRFPTKRILFALPFARGTKRLKQLCPDSFSISKETYARCQFPDRLQLPSGKYVTIPDDWRAKAKQAEDRLIPDELDQRVDHLMGAAIGILRQWIFLLPLIQSEDLWKDLDHRKSRGLAYLKSTNLRYLLLNVALLWQTERKNKNGEIIHLMNSIPEAQQRLPQNLPEPEEDCHDGRKDCVRDLRKESKKDWCAIRKIRNKSIAHSELTRSEGSAKIDPFSVSDVELNIEALQSFVRETLVIADALNHVVRSAGFSWEDLAQRERTTAEACFGVTDFHLSIPELNISI